MFINIEFIASVALLGAIASMAAFTYVATRTPKQYQPR
jgi:hypothetical protein